MGCGCGGTAQWTPADQEAGATAVPADPAPNLNAPTWTPAEGTKPTGPDAPGYFHTGPDPATAEA